MLEKTLTENLSKPAKLNGGTTTVKETFTHKGTGLRNNLEWTGPLKVTWSNPCSKQGQL